jgi:hypothetical protein
MVYGMEKTWGALILVILLLCSSGCLDTLFGEPPNKPATPVPTAVPTTQGPLSAVPLADMALQLSDLPSDYTLRDRSVMTSPEVPQLTRDLGWQQGYYVSWYRVDSDRNDITQVRQSISIFALDSMNGVFLIEKEELQDQEVSPATRYEIPFPAIGERSIAFRDSNPADTDMPVIYTVIFTKKNVFEKITMSGTSTDYETLKRVVQTAAARV